MVAVVELDLDSFDAVLARILNPVAVGVAPDEVTDLGCTFLGKHTHVPAVAGGAGGRAALLERVVIVTLAVAVVGQNNFDYFKRLSHIAIVLSLIGFIVDRIFRKIAYKIVIDFDNRKTIYHMCRSSKIKSYTFKNIKNIIFKNYITFVFEDDKILYNPSNKNNIDYKKIIHQIEKNR